MLNKTSSRSPSDISGAQDSPHNRSADFAAADSARPLPAQEKCADSAGSDSGLKRTREDTPPFRPRDYPRHSALRSPSPAPPYSKDGSERFNFPVLTSADFEPYLLLEQQYREIFSTTEITHLALPRPDQFGTLPDVGADKVMVVNTARDGVTCIGTCGVATCIAICARAKNSAGETLLGICHATGITGTEEIVVRGMHWAMEKRGALDTKIYLLGGMVNAQSEGGGTLEKEAEYLSLNRKFNIAGARLHLSKGEVDPETLELNGVHVVLSEDHVFYSEKDLFIPREQAKEPEADGEGDSLVDVLNGMLDEAESEFESDQTSDEDRASNTPSRAVGS